MSDAGVFPAPGAVQLTRMLPGPIERAWQHLAEPALLAEWLGAGTLEPREGGAVKLQLALGLPAGAQAVLVRGAVLAWEPPARLSYTWIDAHAGSVVTFALEQVRGDVQLDLALAQVAPPLRALAASNWHAFVETLRARLQGTPPEPFAEVLQRVLPRYQALAALAEPAKAD